MKSETLMDGRVPSWELFECDAGCRWAQLKGSSVSLCKIDGEACAFSGCRTGHFTHKVGETTDRAEASGWFWDANEEKRG